MRDSEGFPVKYLSLHNEGDFGSEGRWSEDGTDSKDYFGHDYNMLWPFEQVNDFLKFMPELMQKHGVGGMKLANGECTTLGLALAYAKAISADPDAVRNLGLFSSHAFGSPDRVFISDPIVILSKAHGGTKFWVTSETWGKMDMDFIWRIYQHIYTNKANAYIPWACVQRHSQWTGGDPNPGTAILIHDDGSWEVLRGYYLYKHWCRVGKAGMSVADISSSDAEVLVAGFAKGGANHPDAVVVINNNDSQRSVTLTLSGTNSEVFSCAQTTNDEHYASQEDKTLKQGSVSLEMPPYSIITLAAK